MLRAYSWLEGSRYFGKISVGKQRCVRRLSNAQTSNPTSGLFGLQGLHGTDSFQQLAIRSTKSIDQIRDYLKANRSLPATQTLALLDSISAELCAVLDAAELCRNVHQSMEFKASAEEAFDTLSSFLHVLNADDSLHARLKEISSSPAFATLTEEEKLFTENLRLEFESDGIHLQGRLKEMAMQLRSDVVSSETTFSQNLNSSSLDDPSALIQVGPFEDIQEMQHLRSWTEQYISQSNSSNTSDKNVPSRGKTTDNSKGHYFTASKDKRISSALLASIAHEPVRRSLWLDSHFHPASNIEPLGQLIKSRQMLARSLGYDSYVHKMLYNKAYRTPEEVQDLLLQLGAESKQKALQELDVLAALKSGDGAPKRSIGVLDRLFGSTGDEHAPYSEAESTLQPWDILYLSNQHGNSATGQTNARLRAQAKVKEYLSVDACINGLQLISKQLFNIDLEKAPMEAHESWAQLPGGSDASGDNLLIQKYLVRDASSGALIGTVLMDLFERDNKFPGSAHFTVQCGCTRTHITTTNRDGVTTLNESAQLPIVALVFHFKAPRSTASTTSVTQHALLSLQDIETLHHEWGHALHSLLSQTRYQHLSGTRGGTDFVEVPSHWCEYYARAPAVISQWARHHLTGEKVPAQLLEQALEGARPFPAIDIQNQILYSAVDQYLFGTAIGDVSALSPAQVFERAVRGIADVQSQYTVLPLARALASSSDSGGTSSGQGAGGKVLLGGIPGTAGSALAQGGYQVLSAMNMLDHGHLVNYGGAYYSYLFAKLYAAHIWHAHFAADPLNRDAGRFLNDRLLRHGSSRPAAPLLAELVGGKLDPSYYLQQLFR